jgi:diguanylate cyclase
MVRYGVSLEAWAPSLVRGFDAGSAQPVGRMVDLAATARGGRAVSPGLGGAAGRFAGSGARASVRLAVPVSVYFALYVGWRLSSWGSVGTRAVVGDVFLLLPGFPTVVLFWLASRRCAESRTASAWRWLALSVILLTASFGFTLGYQATAGVVPFPSAADVCYLLFNVFFLVGLLRFPKRLETRAGKLRLGVDLAMVVLAGASVIWFLVLGPTVTASGGVLLDRAVAGAYPIGDLLQIFGLTYAVTRMASRSTQRALWLLAGSALVAIVGDLTNGWMILHADYSLKLVVDLAFMGAWGLLVLSGPAQRSVVANGPVTTSVTSAPEAGWVGRAGWLPYLAPALVFGLAMYAQFGGSLFDRVSLAVAGALISFLVLARQFFASQDLLSAQDKLSHRAFHDALTGLPNRPLLLDRLERAMVQSEGGGRRVAVMMLDLDKFKHVNDTLGHAAGDELLQALAEVLPRAIRPSDTVARFGGDEFAFVIHGIEGELTIVTIAERILAAVAEPFLLGGRRRQVRGTLGIVIAQGGESAGGLLSSADLAMYRAKEENRGGYEFFDIGMRARVQRNLTVEGALAEALEAQQLTLYYQPIVALDDGRLLGLEALLRWQHPRWGWVQPSEFIPIAEETGLIIPLSQYVIAEAARHAAAWNNRYPGALPWGIAINLTPRELSDKHFLSHFEQAVSKQGAKPSDLTIEVTERTFLDLDHGPLNENLIGLHQLGARLSLDDFGTGYSALSSLQRFPFSIAKIDRFFTRRITDPSSNAPITDAISKLAHTLGMQAIAEGVETPLQADYLRTLGCDAAQGFHFARPQPASDITARLEYQQHLGTAQAALRAAEA